MPLETATHIADLNAANPAVNDPKSQGDDHIRLLKSVLRTTLPNANAPITVTPAELNALANVLTTGAALRVTTQTVADSSAAAASTAFVQSVAASLAGGAPVPLWVSGTTYAAGALVYSPTDFQTYRRRTAGAGTTDPAASADWQRMTAGGSLVYESRTSNTALADGDFCKFIDLNGTFSQTFVACAGLRSGWWAILRNVGAGDITLDPSASEQIDGLTSYVMYPGEARLIQCNGTALRSIVLAPFSRTFTTSGEFIKPPGYIRFAGQLWGGGASGARNATAAGGGGGGACHPFDVQASLLAAVEEVWIGAGGEGVTGTADGNNGGTTIIGTLAAPKLQAFGGGGGAQTGRGGGGGGALSGGNFDAQPGFGGEPGGLIPTAVPRGSSGFGGAAGGGTSATGTPAGASAYGGAGGGGTTTGGNPGGASVYGGAGGAGVNSTGATAAGGTSVLGGAGGASGNTTSGTAGTAPGGGGGATRTGTTSGAGARGEARIWGIA